MGFWSLAAQFIFNRIIFFYLAHSDFVAASIITVHLTGFLMGTLIAPRVRASQSGMLSAAFVLSWLAALIVWRAGAPALGLSATIGLTILFGVCLATLSGMLLIRLMEEGGKSEQGRAVVMADSAGSVLGAAAGGFYLVPYAGVTASFGVLFVLQGLALLIAAQHERRLRRAGAVVAIGFVAGHLVLAQPGFVEADGAAQREWAARLLATRGHEGSGEEAAYAALSPFGLVSVLEGESGLRMMLDNKPLCAREGGNLEDHFQYRLGRVPAEMVAHNVDAGQAQFGIVGLGCGFTLAGALSKLERTAKVEVIEINPGIAPAQKLFWPELPFTPEDPRVTLTIEDGFTHFAEAKSGVLYDAVVLDLSWADDMVATHLFSREMFRNISARLKPDGVLALWMLSSSPFSRESLIGYRTLKRVFPYVYADEMEGAIVFFASKREDIVNYLSPEAARISSWLLDLAQEGEINTLDTLALGRLRVRAAWEGLSRQ